MSGLTTYQDPGRREDIGGKPKAFTKSAYWNMKRSQKIGKHKKK